MSKNQKPLAFSHIRARHRQKEAPKRHFRHYMAQIGPNFPPETSLRCENPRDGTRDPWDGNRNPRDGAGRTPRPAAFPTLKRGQPWAPALTLCHIAHKVSRAAERPPQPKPHREAGDPIGVEPSITAGEPKANPRKGHSQQWDPIGVQLPITAGTPQAHPRTARCCHTPRPRTTTG